MLFTFSDGLILDIDKLRMNHSVENIVSIKVLLDAEMKLECFEFVQFKDIACNLGYGLFENI